MAKGRGGVAKDVRALPGTVGVRPRPWGRSQGPWGHGQHRGGAARGCGAAAKAVEGGQDFGALPEAVCARPGVVGA